jgi:hypothetical protein
LSWTERKEAGHRPAGLAVILPDVFHDQRRCPSEPFHDLEWQPALGDVPRALLRIKRFAR